MNAEDLMPHSVRSCSRYDSLEHGQLVGIVALADIPQSAQSSAVRITEILGLARTLASVTEQHTAESVAAR